MPSTLFGGDPSLWCLYLHEHGVVFAFRYEYAQVRYSLSISQLLDFSSLPLRNVNTSACRREWGNELFLKICDDALLYLYLQQGRCTSS